MKNKSLLSATCLNHLVKAIAGRTAQHWWDLANKSNFGLPLPVFSLKLSTKQNPGGPGGSWIYFTQKVNLWEISSHQLLDSVLSRKPKDFPALWFREFIVSFPFISLVEK